MDCTRHSETFHALHHRALPLFLPNIWDYITGATLADAGFSAIGTTSAGLSAVAGKQDGAGATRTETVDLARQLVRLDVPIAIDIESGFSEHPEKVAELAAQLADLGVAGVDLEDCAIDGSLRTVEHQVAVLAAVRAAAPRLFLNARTNTHWLGDGVTASLSEARARAVAYAEAGADGIYVPGLATAEDIRAVSTATDLPLNVVFLPGRHSVRGLSECGVKRISSGSLLFRVAVHATYAAARGMTGDSVDPVIPTNADIQRLIPHRSDLSAERASSCTSEPRSS